MRTKRLYIKLDSGWQELDLFDNVTIPLTFKVTDIREFGSKTSGYSLDFQLPNTPTNAKAFGIAEEIDGYEGSFEWGKDYPAYLTDNDLTTFEGQFRLRKVIKKNDGRFIYYVGYLYGGAKSFIDALGSQTLTGNDLASDDIDFSAYNTPAEEMTLQGFKHKLESHDTSGEEWKLTLIDKTNKEAVPFANGGQKWYADELTPYLGVMAILERIIAKAGWNYVSEFLTDGSPYLTDDRWKDTIGQFKVWDLIYPYMRNNQNLISDFPTSSVIAQTQGTLSRANVVSRDYTLPLSTQRFLYIQSNVLVFNPFSYSLTEQNVTSSLSAYKFVAPEDGIYAINVNIPIKLKMNMAFLDNGSAVPIGSGVTIHNGPKYMGRDEDYERFSGSTQLTLEVRIEKNGQPLAYVIDEPLIDYPESWQTESNNGTITLYEDTMTFNSDIPLSQGDVITFRTWLQIPVKYDWYVPQSDYWQNLCEFLVVGDSREVYPTKVFLEAQGSNNDTIVSFSSTSAFFENVPFYPNCILNPKTTKVDFIGNLLKMFNLYVEDVSGKKNYKTGETYPPNTLRIEPYEIFYSPQLGANQSNVKDWTKKIDWNDVEYRRCEDYLYNIQRLAYADNKDTKTSSYNETYKTPYMQRDVIGNYCVSDKEVNEIKNSNGAAMCGLVNSDTDTIQCPKAFTINNKGEVDAKKEYNDSIFFIWRNKTMDSSTQGTNYFVFIQSELSSNYEFSYDYWCADTLNKGYGADTANLSFGENREWLQNLNGGKPSTNDLFNAFYKKQYEDFTSDDAKIMKAKIFLTAYDIATLQMSDTIIIKGNAWHILEINQWKNEREAVEIELIKTKPNR